MCWYNKYCIAKQEHGFWGCWLVLLKNRYPLQKMLVFCLDQKTEDTNDILCINRYNSTEKMDEVTFQALSVFSEEMALRLKQPEGLPAGHEVWIGEIEGKFVGACWSRGGEKRTDFWGSLSPNDSYIWACHVIYDFRGQGVFPSMLRCISNILLQEGQRKIFIDCKANNKSSIRGISKAGFEYIGYVMRFVLGRKRYVLRKKIEYSS